VFHLNTLSETNDLNRSTLLHSGVALWNSVLLKVWQQKDQNSHEQYPEDGDRRSLPDVGTYYKTTLPHITEDTNLHTYHHENLKFHKKVAIPKCYLRRF
jgi:hypothetical protein